MTTIVQARTQQLRHHLDPVTASTPCDQWWLLTRAHEYAAAAGIAIDVVLDAWSYRRRTGLDVGRWWAGAAYTGMPGERVTTPLVYLNPRLIPTRGEGELVIAHEIMHCRWPSYGHRAIAFTRAQGLLDRVAGMPARRQGHRVVPTRSARAVKVVGGVRYRVGTAVAPADPGAPHRHAGAGQ